MSEYEWGEYAMGAASRRSPIIVSRHAAAIDFIRQEANLPMDTPIVESATDKDVAGRVVYGNLPMHLAACAAMVWAVEFSGQPPRGAEYSADDMRRAGARLRAYRVQTASCHRCGAGMSRNDVDEYGTVCDRCRGMEE